MVKQSSPAFGELNLGRGKSIHSRLECGIYISGQESKGTLTALAPGMVGGNPTNFLKC